MGTSRRVVIDVSNLSIHALKFIRTGIQEVIYKTLLSLVEIRKEYPEVELILLPQLPRRFGNFLSGSTTVPYQNPAIFILEGIEKQLGLSSSEVWGFDLKAKNYRLTDEETFQWIQSADYFHIQSMVNVGPLMETLKETGSKVSNHLSMTIYDLVPVLFPEYCDHGLARWFQSTYVPAIGQYVNHAVCISRNTAMDLKADPFTQKVPHVSVLPLPLELTSKLPETSFCVENLGLKKKEYFVFLGSLEPRKNFESLLEGFELFRKLTPQSSVRLVLVGATGWKNFITERRIRKSPVREDILRPGYISDENLNILMKESLGLVMVSQYEGYGLPVAQAFSLGVPIVTTLGSSLPEACGGEAIFVEPHNPWSVCAGLQSVFQGSKPIHSFERFENWNWKNYARQLLNLILGGSGNLRRGSISNTV